MSTFSFHAKRAYFDALARMRPLVAAHGLTPARVDLLHTLHESPEPPRQQDLRAALKVSSATVSEMLSALEAMGLVRRRRSPLDLRAKLVELTDEGRARVRSALRDLTANAALAA